MTDQQQLPSDALTKPTRRLPWILGSLGAAALVTAGVLAGPAIGANLTPAPSSSPSVSDYHPTLTPSELDSVQQAANDQAKTIADDKAAADAAAAAEVADALAASHQQQTGDGPIQCAAGYTANAVDSAGNESNCQKDGPGGQPCVAYNDQNQCTAYLKP